MADLKEWREPATGEDKIKMDCYVPMITIKDGKKMTNDVAKGVKPLKIVEGNMQSYNVRPGGKYEVEAANKTTRTTNNEVGSDRE